jgi:hypothetical protein
MATTPFQRTFQRVVRDGVFDTVTTNTLSAQTATIKTLNATTINATTVNATSIVLPTPTEFILDANAVFGPFTGAIWTFSRVGNEVTAQFTADGGVVANSNFLSFPIPAPYTPTAGNNQISPAAMVITPPGTTFFGYVSLSPGFIHISPTLGGIFTAGTTAIIFSTTIKYILV